MAQVPRRVLDFWEAIDRVDPLPDPWLQTAQTSAQIDQLIAAVLASRGSQYEPRGIEDFMPARWIAPKKPKSTEPAKSVDDICREIDRVFER